MIKLGLVFKETSEKQIKDDLKKAQAVFIVKYLGVASSRMSALRQSLTSATAKVLVVKNSVARRALKDCGLEVLVKNIEGPCGIVFAADEPVATSRVLYDFSRGNEHFKLESGFLKDRLLEKKDIEALAKLPGKEVLRAQAVMTLKSPLSGLVMVLAGNLRKLVYCLDQIKNKKENH